MNAKKLKVTLSVVALFLICSFSSQAQVYQKGSSFINAGIGLGNRYSLSGSSGDLSLHATYELGITEEIGVGGIFGYSSFSDNAGGPSNSLILFGARGAYHFDANIDNMDLYAGATLGYYSFGGQNLGVSVSGLSLGIFAGGRYMFSDNIGAFAELGYTMAFLNLGLAIKL